MKSIGQIYHQIHSWDNLKLAYYKASKRKRNSPSGLRYRMHLDENLKKLRDQIIDGNIQVGNYHYFSIYEPKERNICAAPFHERVLHHAVINITEPYFEKFAIHHSYACRRNKGTGKAVLDAFHYSKTFSYFLKLDVRKYFDSIDHGILKTLLAKKFRESELNSLFHTIIDSYETRAGKGLPIGNLTSQHFANFYLTWLDHYIKSALRIKGYVRYMDDMVLWSNGRNELQDACKKVTVFLKDRLELELKEAIIGCCSEGVPFLGFRITRSGIFLTGKRKKKLQKKLKEYYQLLILGKWSQQEFANHVLPVCSAVSIARSRKILNTVIQRYDRRLEPG